MKTPQIPAMPGMTPLGMTNSTAKAFLDALPSRQMTRDLELLNRLATDQKTVAERQWKAGKLAPAPQKPCDHGLFSDDANQRELF